MKKQELHPRTAVINRSQKLHARKSRHDALSWLKKRFPESFDNSITIRPLKHGIMEDILAHAEEAMAAGISKSKLREAVVIFTRRIDYLICLKSRELRIDLFGQTDVAVTEEEAERATAKIRKRIEKSIRNAKKAATKDSTSSPAPYSYQVPRAPLYSTQAETASTKQTAVTIKHKVTKPYDPSAVARLKARLGLSVKDLAE